MLELYGFKIKNMINSILKASKEYIDSKDYDQALNSIRSEFTLNEDDLGYLSSIVNSIILGTIPEESFVESLKDISDIKMALAQELYRRSKELIFTPFKTKLAKTVIDKQQEAVSEGMLKADMVIVPKSNLLRQDPEIMKQAPIVQPQPQPIIRQQPIQPQPAPYQDSLNKHDILHEIENPPRTVIKKYVLEHEPITDPEHLIDDSVDARTKLEEHYNN